MAASISLSGNLPLSKVTIVVITCLLCWTNSVAQKRFVELDSTQIWVHTIGLEDRRPGQPVLVFESGTGTPMGHWDKLLDEVPALAPVVLYDRPGVGQSEADGGAARGPRERL